MAHDSPSRPATTTRSRRIARFFKLSLAMMAAASCSLSACRTPGTPAANAHPQSRSLGPASHANAARSSDPLPSPAPIVDASAMRRPALPLPEPMSPAVNGAIAGDVQLVEHLEVTPGVQPVGPTLPPQAWTGHPADGYTTPGYAGPLYQGPHRVDMPGMIGPAPQWAPPGILRPWPVDEYIFDGGDRELAVQVNPDFSVRGLEQEDTVVHYDTLDGETIVKPSNRVCIYAPRFASVRKVYGVDVQEQRERMLVVDKPAGLISQELRLPPTTVLQPIQPERENGLKVVDVFEERAKGVEFENVAILNLARENLLPFEDFRLVRYGVADNAEKARLAASIDAAIAWTENQAVQVVVDEKPVAVEMGIETAGTLVETKRYGKPCVRICKLASRKAALPGDVIDFTIRFDNIGTDLAGNVTIVDNLTTRLEYVPDSAQCSLQADFLTEENEGETLILRWEIKDPLPSGQGGVIRFRCRVR